MRRLGIIMVLFLFACQSTYQPAVPVEDIMNGPEIITANPEPVEVPEVEEVEKTEVKETEVKKSEVKETEVKETKIKETEVEEMVNTSIPEPKGDIVNIDVILKNEHAKINVMFDNDEENFVVDNKDKSVILGMLSGKYGLSTQTTERLTTFLQEATAPIEEKETDNILYSKVVEILGYKYTPEVLYVKPHTRVIWNHKDLASHTVTSSTGLFDSDGMIRGDLFSYDFHEVGAYEYFSAPYPSMRGKIIVKEEI